MPEQCRHGGTAIAGGEKLAGALGLGATGHGSTNRGHRGREEVQVTSPRPRMRPEDTVGRVVAMAGDAEVLGPRGLGLRGHETRN